MLTGLMHKDYLAIMKTKLERKRIVMLCFRDDPDVYSRLSEEEAKDTDNYISCLTDVSPSKDNKSRNVAKRLKDMWAIAYGDPNSPDIQQAIDSVAEGLRTRRTTK